MTGLSRLRAAQVLAEYFGTPVSHDGGYYGVYSVLDGQSRRWKVMSDGSITTEKKEILNVELKGGIVPAMAYIMNSGHPFGAPSDHYLNTILEGYESAGFDTEVLKQAVEKSIRLAEEQQPEQENLFGRLARHGDL